MIWTVATKLFKTVIMLHMHIIVFTTKICPLLNFLFFIAIERFDNMIDTVRIGDHIEFSWKRVYNSLAQ